MPLDMSKQRQTVGAKSEIYMPSVSSHDREALQSHYKKNERKEDNVYASSQQKP